MSGSAAKQLCTIRCIFLCNVFVKKRVRAFHMPSFSPSLTFHTPSLYRTLTDPGWTISSIWRLNLPGICQKYADMWLFLSEQNKIVFVLGFNCFIYILDLDWMDCWIQCFQRRNCSWQNNIQSEHSIVDSESDAKQHVLLPLSVSCQCNTMA